MDCRHCKATLSHTFIDLGFAPPSNSYLTKSELTKVEIYYPLKVKVCDSCWLVQTEDYAGADELFTNDYAYFSSTSKSWLLHAELFAKDIIEKLELSRNNFIIEVASNDGYLLKNFINYGIPCLGIEPTESTANAAEKLGIPILKEFFSEKIAKSLAKDGKKADLIVANNVLAHVPDINDFTKGLKAVLKKSGTISIEFPHLLSLIEGCQFDTIYHEHFSYLSLISITSIFDMAGLRVWDVEKIKTHGGSLRIFGCHKEDLRKTKKNVFELMELEIEYGLNKFETYYGFQSKAEKIKDNLISFLIEQKRNSRSVVAYGAAAKGNTLINFAGIKQDLLTFVCDSSASKQGKYLPGSHIPIFSLEHLINFRPDNILILPWNISAEIHSILKEKIKYDVNFMTVVPNIEVLF